MKNIYEQIPELTKAGSRLVLATVTENRGSTPQKPGSSALFDRNGLLTGTVGGGVVEGRVKEFSVNSLTTHKSGYLQISLNNEITEIEEAICGGQISILVDAEPARHMQVWKDIQRSLNSRKKGILITKVISVSDEELVIERFWISDETNGDFPSVKLGSVEAEVKEMLSGRGDRSCRLVNIPGHGSEPGTAIFLEPLFPMPKLIIAGAGHIGKAVSHIGYLIGFEVTVIDDRSEFANAHNLPDAENIVVKDISSAMGGLDIAHDTYIVIVTRGHKDDAGALRPCIGSSAAYIGMIGSKSKVARMHTEFIEKGWATEKQWQEIYTPIGLEINSKTVQEIAVSIAAQLIQVRNRKL